VATAYKTVKPSRKGRRECGDHGEEAEPVLVAGQVLEHPLWIEAF